MRTLKALLGFLSVSVVAGLLCSLFLVAPAIWAGAGAKSSVAWFEALPSKLPDEPLPGHSVILAADGSPIADFFSENRAVVSPDQLPQVMKDAIVSIEDTRFYEHGAMDLRGFMRALRSNLLGGQRQGASTITQQYVKNVLLAAATSDQDRRAATETTIYRKLREARYAVEVEQTMSKDEILAGYLNASFFGANAYGIGAASQRYFSVPVEELTLTQASLLAGLVQSPSSLNPLNNPDGATDRRNVVLRRMFETGRITEEEMEQAQAAELGLNPSLPANGCTTSKYPYYCEWIKSTMRNDPAFGETPEARERFLYVGGVTITTSLDPKIQDAAQAAMDAGLGRDNRVGGALVVVQPGTGKVLAMVQNRTFGDEDEATKDHETQVNYATSKFQNGSTFKPFTAVAALENGWDLNKVMNAPFRHCVGEGSGQHCMYNHGDAGTGSMTLTTAIARSSNTYFTLLTQKYGSDTVAETANRMGLGLPEVREGDLTLTLGTYEVSPVNLANAYATILAHGVACQPVGVVEVKRNSDGVKLPSTDPQCRQVVEPRIADLVAGAMRGVVNGGDDPARTGRRIDVPIQVAGKTGTTDSSSAVWFSGGTPDFAMAVWLGDPRGGYRYPLDNIRVFGNYVSSAYGSTGAGPIWEKAVTDTAGMFPGTPFQATSPTVASTIIPDVRGMKDVVAFQVLRDAGFVPEVSPDEAAGSVALPPNVVSGTNPGPGARALPGATVEVVMSPGSDRNLVESKK